MKYEFGKIMSLFKQASNYNYTNFNFVDYNIDTERTVFQGFGIEALPCLIFSSIIPNSEYTFSDRITKEYPKKTTFVIYSYTGNQDSQDFFRSCIRKGYNDIIFLTNNQKIEQACKLNNASFIYLPDKSEIKVSSELISFYEFLVSLKLFKEKNLINQDIDLLGEQISRMNFEKTIQDFLFKSKDKEIILTATPSAYNTAKIWQLFFLFFGKKSVSLEEFPNFLYSQTNNLAKNNLILFFLDENEPSLLKRKITYARESIPLQSLEIILKGTNKVNKVLFSALTGFLLSHELNSDQNDEKINYEKIFQEYARRRVL